LAESKARAVAGGKWKIRGLKKLIGCSEKCIKLTFESENIQAAKPFEWTDWWSDGELRIFRVI